jgi:hypothetical protein
MKNIGGSDSNGMRRPAIQPFIVGPEIESGLRRTSQKLDYMLGGM